jgi:DNA-directed RNA polymerase subunit RPC12/RpoP
MCEFENEKYVVYGEGATFVRRCAKCYRFVKAPETICLNPEESIKKDNIECSKCGPTHLIFIGFF